MQSKLFLLLLLIFSANFASAQYTKDARGVEDQMVRALAGNGNRSTIMTFDNRIQDVKGSPFLLTKWLPGYLDMTNNRKFHEGLVMLYDAQKNEIHVKDKGSAIILFNEELLTFSLIDGNEQLDFQKIVIKNEKPDQFYQIVTQSTHYTLIKKHKVTFRPSDFVDKGMVQSGKPYDEYVKDAEYFFKIKDGEFQPVQLKKKSVLALFSPSEAKKLEKERTLKEALTNKMSENDMIRVIAFLEQSK